MIIRPDIHYQVLEIEVGASQTEIKQAFRDLAKVWHPDRFADDPRLQQKAAEKLKRIIAAYEFLKSYHPVPQGKVEPGRPPSATVPISWGKLEKLLGVGQWKEADQETKRLVLELAGREREGWLLPEDPQRLPLQTLAAIDQLWAHYSSGRFGFSVQREIWHRLGCKSSDYLPTQKVSENQFGQTVHWRIGNRWLSPSDGFYYGTQAPQGSLPRAYIFALSGWWRYSRGLAEQHLLRFDQIFLRL
jgi:hypothetical protein